jgi:hypothetical protein
MHDGFSEYYGDLLAGQYDCPDRVALNACFRLAHSPGGFRTWWRAWCGSEEHLDDAHLRRLCGRFGRRLRAFARANGIPLVACPRGERQHLLAKDYMPQDPDATGVFAIFKFRAAAPVWSVKRSAQGVVQHLEWKKPYPYVNHYAFHILDPEWGHVTIQMCAHPPWRARVLLNGHEWVACTARRKGVPFIKEDNCFTSLPSAAGLASVADTLSSPSSVGRLAEVCERWIYSACLAFALPVEEQRRTRFRYQYSVYQAEYSRNLLFRRADRLEAVYQGMIDRTRAQLDVRKITTVFGRRRRPATHRRRGKPPREQRVLEKPTYDLTVFKIHFGALTVKCYDKGERVLRVEAIAHDAKALGCGRDVSRFPDMVAALRAMVVRVLDTLHCVDASCIDAERLETLPDGSRVGRSRVGGVDVNRPRMRAVLRAVTALSAQPGGFRARDVAAKVRDLTGWTEEQYGTRRASYDLKKLRGKDLVETLGNRSRYHAPHHSLRFIAALMLLRDHVTKPIVALASSAPPMPLPDHHGHLDTHYRAIEAELRRLFHVLGIAA